MSKMSLKEALAAVLKDMEALSADELRADLEKHSTGTFATAMRKAREFLANYTMFRGYHMFSSRMTLEQNDEHDFAYVSRSVRNFECITTAVNDNSYALAA